MKTANVIVIAAILAACGLGSFLQTASAGPAHEGTQPSEPIATLGSPHFLHHDWISNLAFCLDGKTLLAVGSDACLWDMVTGQKLRQWNGFWMCGSLSADGRTVALSANATNIDVFDVGTGRQVARLAMAQGRSDAVAISPDGRRVAGGSSEVVVWDVPSGKDLRRWATGANTAALCFLPGGRRLAIAGEGISGGMSIRTVDGNEPPVELDGGTGFRAWFAPSPDGKMLAGSCDVGHRSSLRFWDTASGRTIRNLPGSFNHGAFSADGKWFAASGLDKVEIIDVATDRQFHELPPCHEHIRAVAFSPDGKKLATGQGQRIRFWETAAWKEIEPTSGHNGPVKAVAFSPDGRTIATGGLDGTIIFWSWPEAALRRIEGVGDRSGISHLTFSPDGRTIAASAWINNGDTFFLFDAATGRPVSQFGKNHQGAGAVVFLPGGQEVLTGQIDGSLAVWDAATGALPRSVGSWPAGHRRSGSFGLCAVQLGNESGTAWWVADGLVGLRDLTTGKDLRVFRTGLPAPMLTTRLSMSPDGDWLAMGHRLWDAKTGEAITHGIENTISHGFDAVSAVSPDGRLFAFPWGREIMVWEALAQTKVRTLGTDKVGINGLAFSPDGTVLAAAAESGTLVWDMTGRLRQGRLEAVELTAVEMEASWNVLGGEDAWAAQQAAWKLATGGAAAVSFLGERLRAAPVPKPLEIEAVRDRLTDPDYGVREIAARTLLDLGISLSPDERELLRRPAPRIEDQIALPAFGRRPPPAPPRLLPPPVLLPLPLRLQMTRALAALEHSTAHAAAAALLAQLVDGAPDVPFTRTAKATLVRVRKL